MKKEKQEERRIQELQNVQEAARGTIRRLDQVDKLIGSTVDHRVDKHYVQRNWRALC